MGERARAPGSEAEELFDRLLELPEAQRLSRLDAVAGERPELADALAELEHGYEHARDVLERMRAPACAGAPEAAWDDPLPPPGQELTDRGLVGRGGMGEVREVWDAALQRRLALKRLLDLPAPARVRARRRARFFEEARIAGRLQHPGVVPVHALGIDPRGLPYYTMPLIEGEDLGQVMQRVRRGDPDWPLARALEVLIRVCDTMAYAHGRGVVHRDLKPANVMVGPFGEVYVMDWGLATLQGRPDTKDIRPREPDPPAARESGSAPAALRTMDGDVLGTPGYMSPEQALGRVEEVGALSDVYSVGCMLYQLLAGQAPYADGQGCSRLAPDVLRLLRTGPPQSLEQLAPAAPPELVAICARAMARTPRERFGGMAELARELRAWRDGRVVRSYEHGSWAELRKWVGRNRGLAAALTAALLATVGGLGSVAWVQTRASERLLASNVQLDEAHRTAGRRLESLQRSLYLNDVALAQHALESYNTANLRALLEDCPPALRGWEWRYLRGVADTSARTLAGHLDDVVAVGFTPDGGRLVSASRDLSLRIWDVERGRELETLCGHPDLVDDLAVSPDGLEVATACRDGLVRVWPLRAPFTPRVLAGHGGGVASVGYPADSRWLVSGDELGAVLLWDTSSARRVRELQGLRSSAMAVAFSPDGRRVAAGGLDGSVLAWRASDGALERVLREPGGPFVREVVFAPDGRSLAVSTIGSLIEVLDVATGGTLARCAARTGSTPLAWAPDGGRLYAAEFGAVQAWELPRGERGPARLGHAGAIVALDVSPRAALVASGGADDSIRLWDAGKDPTLDVLAVGEANLHALAFAPGSERLAWGGREGRIVVAGARGQGPRSEWQAGQGWVLSLAFHPDGRRLASSGSDGSLRLWEACSGGLLCELRGHAGLVRTIDFDAAGERLLSAGEDGTVRLWDLARGVELARMDLGQPLLSGCFDPAGERVVTCGRQGVVRVVDPQAGATLLEIPAHPGRSAVAAVDPRGERILSGGGDLVLRLWDARTGALLVEAPGHESGVTRVDFSDDGERLLSVGWDGLLKLWDARTGRPLLTLGGSDQPLRALALSPDGTSIAVGGLGGVVRIWHAPGD